MISRIVNSISIRKEIAGCCRNWWVQYSEDDVDALRALVDDSEIFDIFLTNEYGQVVSHMDLMHKKLLMLFQILLDLTQLLRSWLQNSNLGTKGIFFAREPYCSRDVAHVTRFVGLAAVGNNDKQKFIHAISPTPASVTSPAEIQSRPPNTTLSPYIIASKASHTREENKRPANNDVDSQYWRYDVSQKRQKHEGADRLCSSLPLDHMLTEKNVTFNMMTQQESSH